MSNSEILQAYLDWQNSTKKSEICSCGCFSQDGQEE